VTEGGGARADGLVVVERHLRTVDSARWNAFAERNRSSVRLTTGHLRGWAVKHVGRRRLRLFEVHAGGGASGDVVAQCAVGTAGTDHVFLDRLVLAPSAGPWPPVMAAVLTAVGPGTFSYGWELSMEPPREDDIAAIPGVTVTRVRPMVVEAVDFAAWPTWEEYWRAISTNVRRNVKKAQNEIDGLQLDVRSGLGSLRHVPTIIRLRSTMYRRKGLRFRRTAAAVSAVAGIVSARRYALTAVATSSAGPMAAFHGLEFAGSTYYADGGSQAGNSGAAWYLITRMAQRAYDAHPHGRFVMGYVEPAIHDEAVGGGLLRSRRSMRVTSYPTSTVTFIRAGAS